jgi:signal peptidase II
LTNQQGISPSTKQRPAFPTILGLAAIVFGLDQITKFLVLKYIPYGQSWEYLPWLARLFQITYIKNTGAAFGMFPQMGTILMVIAIVVVIGIILFHHHLPVNNIWVRLSLGLQLGGAMGNLLDRIIHGFSESLPFHRPKLAEFYLPALLYHVGQKCPRPRGGWPPPEYLWPSPLGLCI